MNHCGECRVCCEVEAVETIGKPMYAACQHVCERGCGIYDHRPAECRSYSCLWLQGFIAGHERRPDKLGLLIAVADGVGNGPNLVVAEARVGAVEEYGLHRLLYLIDKLPDAVRSLPVLLIRFGQSLPCAFRVDKDRYGYPYPADFGIDCRIEYQREGRFRVPLQTVSLSHDEVKFL